MTERNMRLKLGGFVAATLAILAGFIIAFGGTPRLFSNKAKYTLIFSEAPGIVEGTPIRKSGVRIGHVSTLDLDPESGLVRVGIEVEKKYIPRRSDDATITRGLLSGDTSVDFVPRLTENGQPISPSETYEPGSDITGLPPVTARSLLSQAQGFLPSSQQSLDRIVATFEKFEKLVPKIERSLDEITGLAKDGRDFMPEVKKTNRMIQEFIGPAEPAPAVAPPIGQTFVSTMPVVPGTIVPPQLLRQPNDQRTLRALVADTRATMASAKLTFDNLNDVLSAENRKQFGELTRNLVALSGNLVKLTSAIGGLIDQAERTVKSVNERVTQSEGILNDVRTLTKPLAEKADRMVGNLDLTLDQLAKGMTEIRVLTGNFGQTNGSFNKLFSDPMLYHNLNDAAVSLSRILCTGERIARNLEVFADKIARKPESIGVGGAIRPNSGLKDSPVAPLPSYRPDWPPAVPVTPTSRGGTLLPPVQHP